VPVLDTNQSTTIRMVDFYEFQDPYNEIAGKPKFARSYINIPSAFLEFDLARFQKWYKPFDFSESLPQLEEELWVFRIVMLFPHMMVVITKAMTKRVRKMSSQTNLPNTAKWFSVITTKNLKGCMNISSRL